MAQNKKQNYQIISLIGQGAYGQVYKARRRFTGQFVAIKSIKKKGKQDKDIKAMRQQIKILQKLKHQNIILLLESFQTASQFILVTQLGQGELFNIIEDDHSLQEDQIRKIAQQLVRALYYIHSNRITHRDMKPQNILMTSDGIIKLCDFGFARSMSFQTEVLTSLKGTPLYMAPQVVKQQPYNHTADLWSLGVILYELATGSPPFTAPNLISLVEHISKDPIIYPQIITGDFKHFLKGLLNKDPKKRLGWPDLLHHPFIKQTQQEKIQRKRKTQKFTVWIDQNKISQEETSNIRSVSQGGFDEREKSINRDISPKRQVSSNSLLKVNDASWNKYYNMANQQNGAISLRSDPKFLQQFLIASQTGINQIIRVKDKKAILHIAVTTLVLVLMKSKTPDPKTKKIDISKNFHIPTNLLNILKSLVKIDFGKQYIQLISQIVKVIGLLSRITFQKTFGIEMVYIRSFLPLLPYLIKSATHGTDQNYQTLVNNFLRTIGMFANNASDNIIRSFSFYKDIVEIRFIQQSVQIIKVFYDNVNVLKLFLQVFSALIHPICGDIQCFPWKKKNSAGLVEYVEFATMSVCVKQSVINTLLECNWIQLFQKILQIQDESALVGKMSIKRIILQSIRLSKDFTQSLLFQSKTIIKYLVQTLKGKDYIVSAFSCSILAELLKYMRVNQKQNIFQQYITQSVQNILLSLKGISLLQDLNNNYAMLGLYGNFTILQQILAIQTNPAFIKENSRIVQYFQVEKNMQVFSRFLQNTDKNKIQQMRKIQGSNYGIHSVGLYDPLFFLLHRLFIKISKDPQKNIQSFVTSLGKNQLIQRINGLFSLLSSKTDISPRGLVASLIFVGDLMNTNIAPALINEQLIKAFISLLKQNQLQSILQWPSNLGGGLSCLTIIFGNICKIFLSYLSLTEKQPQILRILYQYNLVQHSLNFAKHLNEETIYSIISLMNHLIAFDKFQKVDKIQNTFAKQFVDSGGMALFSRFNLLSKDVYDPSSLIQSCNLLSQLARGSKQFYPHISSILPYEQISKLFMHSDVQVKSKVLNLIGNMCRHSSYFYQKLATTGIIKQCIKLCEDQDKTIKKFACVAIGNASFHDSTLYEILRPSISLLVSLIKDGQQKTRSNAVAALGNLARNSDSLDKQFINSGANYQLVNVISNDKSLSTKKVSVMAIINLLSLPQSRNVLLNLKIDTVLKKFTPPQYNGDVGLTKTCQKALQKLQK